MPSAAEYKAHARKRLRERGGKELRVELDPAPAFALAVLKELLGGTDRAIISTLLITAACQISHAKE